MQALRFLGFDVFGTVVDRRSGVARRHGLDPAGIPEQELADLNRAWERLDPSPDFVQALRADGAWVVAADDLVDLARQFGN